MAHCYQARLYYCSLVPWLIATKYDYIIAHWYQGSLLLNETIIAHCYHGSLLPWLIATKHAHCSHGSLLLKGVP